jgi:hypothetical protein
MITPFYFNINIGYDKVKLIKIYNKLKNKTYYTYGKNNACLTIVPIKNYTEILSDILDQFVDSSIITDAAFLHNTHFGILDPHIDETRFCAINIPITITNSSIQFYKCKQTSVRAIQTVNVDGDTITREGGTVCTDCSLVDEINYTSPIVFNAAIPHGVKNNSDLERIILSLDVTKDLDFIKISEMYKHKKLIR